MRDIIIEELKKIDGHVGIYYKNLVTGESWGLNEDDSFLAASVIKLPIFMELSRRDAEMNGNLMSTKIKVREEDKVPICGALPLFTGDVTCDIRTLCNLMISLSDNTATNVLIDYLGIDEYNKRFEEMGLKATKLRRKLFDLQAGARGLQNTISPKEMGVLLEKVYRREFVSKEVSEKIEDTLLLQQINHKIPGYLNDKVKCAHKTGEDDNLSNDVGIVYAEEPFVICFTGNHVVVSEFETKIREISYRLCQFK